MREKLKKTLIDIVMIVIMIGMIASLVHDCMNARRLDRQKAACKFIGGSFLEEKCYKKDSLVEIDVSSVK